MTCVATRRPPETRARSTSVTTEGSAYVENKARIFGQPDHICQLAEANQCWRLA